MTNRLVWTLLLMWIIPAKLLKDPKLD